MGGQGRYQQQMGMHGMHQQVVPRARSRNALDPISCSLYTFTNEEISAHMKNIHEGMLLNAVKIKELFMPIIDEMIRSKEGYIFKDAVDPAALKIPDYFDIVKVPMDLGTIKKRLEQGTYREARALSRDTHLVFDNAMLYNPHKSDVHMIAKSMKKDFDGQYKRQMEILEKKTEDKRLNPDNCAICGEYELVFEPPVYYCNGKCQGQRIRRNSWFYTGGNDQYHWCHGCFQDMRDGQIKLPDCTLLKSEVSKTKKKHIEENAEPWVECDECNRWCHQVCAMFNGRRNTSQEVPYLCPMCLVERRKKNPESCLLSNKKMTVADIPHNTLSKFLECGVKARLQKCYDQTCEKEGIPMDKIEKAEKVYVRQVACIDKMQPVREGFLSRYKHKNYPIEFPCRARCIVVFQKIDGQDVLIFGLYVYEYNHKCPNPNQRRVYISYLDSVHYFRPKQYRTPCYQEILVSYLSFVKARGFHTAHIWACPPMKGDDYILHIHPGDQKTPKDDRLRQWYDDMLEDCKEQGIVCELVDLWTEFFENPENDATVLPYFEGDYWVNQVEDIIRDINNKTGNTAAAAAQAAAAHAAQAAAAIDAAAATEEETAVGGRKRKKNTRSTRSIVLSGGKERDVVMARLGDLVKPMRAAHYVARLRPLEYAAEKAAQREAELEKEKVEQSEENEIKKARKLQLEALGDENVISGGKQGGKQGGKGAGKGKGPQSSPRESETEKATEATSASSSSAAAPVVVETVKADSYAAAAPDKVSEKDSATEGGQGVEKDASASVAEGKEEDKQGEDKIKVKMEIDKSGDSSTAAASVSDSGEASGEGEGVKVKSEGKEEGTAAAGSDVAVKSEGDAVLSEADAAAQKEKKEEEAKAKAKAEAEKVEEERRKKEEEDSKCIDLSELKDDTEDPDELQESENFNGRLNFLELCQFNLYQFDQLRRAKHTSMMVLYHLHNPDAPKIVPRCDVQGCSKDILSGYRYHCDSCDVDYCRSCVEKFGSKVHSHQLRPMAVGGAAAVQLTEEQRKEKQRNVQVHLQLLLHSSTCQGCRSRNCNKMKEFLNHGERCEVGVKKGCPQCKRIYTLVHLHARACRSDDCTVFKCQETKAMQRQMAQRQQNMDDRRRQQMNQMYSQGAAAASTGAEEA